MKKAVFHLILLGFLGWAPFAFAQQFQISGKPEEGEVTKENLPDVKLPIYQWNDSNQHIRDNVQQINTFTIFDNHNIAIDIGPGQFMVTFPLN